jgi:hypothetical protein
VGSEHSRKEPFEQLVNGYSEHLHMSSRMPRQAVQKNAKEQVEIDKKKSLECAYFPNLRREKLHNDQGVSFYFAPGSKKFENSGSCQH